MPREIIFAEAFLNYVRRSSLAANDRFDLSGRGVIVSTGSICEGRQEQTGACTQVHIK